MSSLDIAALKAAVLAEFTKDGETILERLEHIIDSSYNRTDDSGGGGLSLGETNVTAYRGDRGKTAYDHSQAAHETPGAAAAAESAANTYTDEEITILSDALTILLAGKAPSLGADDNYLTDADLAKLGGIADGATANSTDATLLNTDNHTNGTTNKVYTAVEKTKLSGIATSATANSSDATLLSTDNHTDGSTNKVFSATNKTKLAGIAASATANDTDANLKNTDNHTDGSTNKVYSATDKTKLAGIASAATANDTDVNLKARANHTGTQLASTVSDFNASALLAAPAETGPTIRTALGTTTIGAAINILVNPSAITFLRVNADNSVTAQSAANFRTDLGATTLGAALLLLANVAAIRFLRVNADNTVSARTAAEMLADIGAQASGSYLTTSNIVATITNGVTTNAPSEDAVFDALALKANLISPSLTTPVIGVATGTSLVVTGALTSSGGGNGYSTGAGGTQVQGTSRTTTVVLSKLCGNITMFSAAQAAQAIVTFTLTNTFIAATDLILIQHISATNAGAWQFSVVAGSGTCNISIRNVSTGSITEATPLRFTIIKGVTS